MSYHVSLGFPRHLALSAAGEIEKLGNDAPFAVACPDPPPHDPFWRRAARCRRAARALRELPWRMAGLIRDSRDGDQDKD